MSNEDNNGEQVYTVAEKNLQTLGNRLAAMQSLNAMQAVKNGIMQISPMQQQWPAVYVSGEIRQKILDLLFAWHKQEIEELTKKPPVDTAG